MKHIIACFTLFLLVCIVSGTVLGVAEEGSVTITSEDYTYTEALGNQPVDIARPAVPPADAADALLIGQIDAFLSMSRDEIIEKLGPDFEVVSAGPEGAMDGYYYEDLSMAFAFYPDSDKPEIIDCYPDFRICGVGLGSLFSEVMEALGRTEIIETWLELPIYTVYMIEYHLRNSDYSFIALEEDEPADLLWISQRPYCGTPGGTRTHDLLIRSQTLYPAELRALKQVHPV